MVIQINELHYVFWLLLYTAEVSEISNLFVTMEEEYAPTVKPPDSPEKRDRHVPIHHFHMEYLRPSTCSVSAPH
jgi:hypothetical protein